MSDAMNDAMRDRQMDTNLRRNLTRAGNLVNESVTNGAVLLDVTLPLAEQDTSYGVSVTPSWNTTYWISNKTATGYRINFGTAAGANATVDATTYRIG